MAVTLHSPFKADRLSWLLYDFANNSFSVMIVTFVYPVYFKSVVSAGLGNLGDLLWGINIFLSLIAVAFLSPILGAVADLTGRKKGFLIISALSCIVLTAQLFWVEAGMVFWGMALFVIANIAYQTGQVFYNAFLPDLASPGEMGRLSGYGWASAYLGGVVVLLFAWPLLRDGGPEKARLVFVLTALFYLAFALPAFLFLRSKPKRVQEGSWAVFLAAGFQQVRTTLTNWVRYRQIVRFLLAYFVYMEGVNTVAAYAGIYAKDTIGFTMAELAPLFLAAQTAAAIGVIGFGFLSDQFGPRLTLILILILWTLVGLGAAVTVTKVGFWFVALIAAICLASVGAVSRTMIALMVGPDQQAEIFGFYSISGRLSSAVGPPIFGLISFLSGSQRAAMFAVALFFLAGLLLLLRVEEPARKKGVPYGA